MKRLFTAKQIKSTHVNIGRLLLPSLLGIIVCMGCLVSLTRAWFTASISTPAQKIQAANYDVDVFINNTIVSNGEEIYSLHLGENIISLSAAGDASTGYCKIIFNGDIENPYYTPQLLNTDDLSLSKSFSFKVEASESTTMTVISNWGTYVVDEEKNIISSGETINLTTLGQNGTQNQTENVTSSDETPSIEGTASIYTVESGDSLWKIAGQYGFTVEILAAYNQIENPDRIYEGQILEIPPADFELTEETTTSISEQSEMESNESTSSAQREETLHASETSVTEDSSALKIPTDMEPTSVSAESHNESSEMSLS